MKSSDVVVPVAASRLAAVTFDVPDAPAAATFWAGLLGRRALTETGSVLVPGDDTQIGLRFVTTDTKPADHGADWRAGDRAVGGHVPQPNRPIPAGGGQSLDLMSRIREFITGWNHRKHPFIWTKPAEQVLAKIDRKRKHVTTTRH